MDESWPSWARAPALASVATGDGEPAAAGLEEAWKHREFAGVMLNTDPADGSAPHDPTFEAFGRWPSAWSPRDAAPADLRALR